jgi:hypothetical protein
VLHFCLSLFSVAGAMPNSAYRSLSTTVLMSSSHNPLPTPSLHSQSQYSSIFKWCESDLQVIQYT